MENEKRLSQKQGNRLEEQSLNETKLSELKQVSKWESKYVGNKKWLGISYHNKKDTEHCDAES